MIYKLWFYSNTAPNSPASGIGFLLSYGDKRTSYGHDLANVLTRPIVESFEAYSFFDPASITLLGTFNRIDAIVPSAIYAQVQGIYRLAKTNELCYFMYEPVEDQWYSLPLRIGTTINGYSSGTRTSYGIKNTLIQRGWLPNDTVVSDVYPELFI